MQESHPNQIDCLIVGQGVAGTLLAHFLVKMQRTVRVIDAAHPAAASRVSLAILNPIQGRQMKLVERATQLLPFAAQTYREFESLLGVPFYFPKNIRRIFLDAKQMQKWSARAGLPLYQQFIAPKSAQPTFETVVDCAPGDIEITGSGFVDLPLLLQEYNRWLAANQMLVAEAFDPKMLHLAPEGISYRNVLAKKIIFCEGVRARHNPFFEWLPFAPVKGETLTIKAPGLFESHILHKGIFVVPMGNGHFRVGATHDNQHLDELPSPRGKDELVAKLSSFLKIPFEIIDHHAALRPILTDHRPVLGLHPKYPAIGIFNGLGSRGLSLGPFYAAQLAQFFVGSATIEVAVDVTRFWR